MEPRVSVIIPCHDAEATIIACVRSVLATGWPDLQVLVVDDASGDGSRDAVRALAREDPRVELLALAENRGPARARNAGARAASGELLFFADSDTEMLPEALERFVARIKEADAVVGVYHAEPLNRGPAPRYKAMLNNYFFSRRGVAAYEVFDSSRAGVRAEVFRASGGFNEDLAWGMDYENEEFGYRLCAEHKMLLDPSIQVRHHFPGLAKMTRDYFFRVALWMEMFMSRRRFESGGVTTGGTGLSSAALLLALPCLALGLANRTFAALGLGLVLIYTLGYLGFFRFVARQRPLFLPAAVALNVYFTLVIALAAAWGAARKLTGRGRA